MMIQRVRLQRKFTLKNKIDAQQRLGQILQMMILFQLIFIVLCSLLSLSPRFHLQHLFTTEFWTVEPVVNSNLALAISIFALLPYLIFYLEVSCSSIKDFVATALTLHMLFSLIVNLRLTTAYTLFLVLLGIIGASLGGYGAVLRQQKKLIDEIKLIEGSDRRDQRIPVEECEKTQLHVPDN